jgi:hypothetical protein
MFSPLVFIILFACAAPPVAATQPVSEAAELTSAFPIPTLAPVGATTPESSPTPEESILFAVIGDYGQDNPDTFAVAEMIDSWHVDFITTTGDNNYPDGEVETIDTNIGQFYHRYIGNYQGEYNRGSEENRFFPSLGNHDWSLGNIEPYLDYFTLPGNERYYDVVQGDVHLIILDSDTNEPDGVGWSTAQADWFRETIEGSESAWQVVVFHHPPYSSAMHGPTDYMQWPFADLGVDVVLSGHDHVYERLEVDGLLYIISGLGGHEAVYDFENILPESQLRYNEKHGALLVEATASWMRFDFFNIDGELIDSVTLTAEAIPQ